MLIQVFILDKQNKEITYSFKVQDFAAITCKTHVNS